MSFYLPRGHSVILCGSAIIRIYKKPTMKTIATDVPTSTTEDEEVEKKITQNSMGPSKLNDHNVYDAHSLQCKGRNG